MSRQTEMAELTRIITCVQKLEQIKALLAKGEKRTLEKRRQEWGAIANAVMNQLDQWTVFANPMPPELPINEATPPSQ